MRLRRFMHIFNSYFRKFFQESYGNSRKVMESYGKSRVCITDVKSLYL